MTRGLISVQSVKFPSVFIVDVHFTDDLFYVPSVIFFVAV